MADYYRILDLEDKKYGKSISIVDLKSAYRKALLIHHPDKHGARTPSVASARNPTVDEITRAYNTLSEPVKRAAYDEELKSHADNHESKPCAVQTRHTGMETLDLEELDFDENTGLWSKSCRCASRPAFSVTEAELEKNVESGEVITGCKGCSLWLRVLFSVAD